MSAFYANGQSVPTGRTYTQDNSVQTFVVQIRSLGGTGCESIKDLLEKKYEVVHIDMVDENIVAVG